MSMNRFDHLRGDRQATSRPRPETLVSLLRHQVAGGADRIAFAFVGENADRTETLSIGDLDRRARHIGVILQSMGAQGSRAIVVLEPGLESISTLFGCFYAGVVAVPVSPPTNDAEFAQFDALLRDSGARHILASAAARRGLTPRLAGQGIGVLAPVADRAMRADEWTAPLLDGTSLALLQYSHGPGGAPRGVMLTHQNLLHNLELMRQTCGITRHDRILTWAAPHHEVGLCIGILLPLHARCSALLMAPGPVLQHPELWLGAVGRHRATITAAPGFGYELCTRRISPDARTGLHLDSLRIALVGHDVVSPGTLDDFGDAFGTCGLDPSCLSPFWGMPETTLLVAAACGTHPRAGSFDPQALHAGNAEISPYGTGRAITNCGHPHPGQLVRIVDPHSASELDDGRIGEIWVGGPSVSRGYWRRRAETMDAFGAFIRNTGEGPFFRTGRAGFVLGGGLHVLGDAEDDIEATPEADLTRIRADPPDPLAEI